MNIEQAKRILDEHKEQRCHSLRTVNKALFLCGDLRELDESMPEIGEAPRLESPHLVESARLGC